MLRTPDAPVADTVRLSMSIPLFFESMQFDGHQLGKGDYYADGSVMRDYAIDVFDDPKFAKDNPWYIGATNWETLGFHTYSPDADKKQAAPIKNLVGFLENLIKAMMNTQAFAFQTSETSQLRTVLIRDCGLSPLNFSMKAGSEDYNTLYKSGKRAATEYLDNYQLPSTS